MAGLFDDLLEQPAQSGSGLFDDLIDKPKPEQGDTTRGFKEAFQQLPQLGYGLVAGAGAAAESALGEGGISTSIKKAGIEGYKAWGDKIAQDAKPSDSWDYSYDQAKEGNFGALVDWLQHGIGYVGGQAIQTLATGGIGAVGGKFVAGTAAKQIAEGMVAKEVATLTAANVGKQIASEEILRAATTNVAAKFATIGSTAALAANATGMEGGEIFGGLTSQNPDRVLTGSELGKAFATTLAAGGLEFVGDKLGLDIMLGKSSLLKPAAGVTGMGGRAARGLIAAGGAAPIEGGTEYAQTLLEEYGKGNDPFSTDALKQARESAALGALGGTVIGGAGGALRSAQQPSENNPPPATPSSTAPIAPAVDLTPDQQTRIDALNPALTDPIKAFGIGDTSVTADDAIAKADAFVNAPAAQPAATPDTALLADIESAQAPGATNVGTNPDLLPGTPADLGAGPVDVAGDVGLGSSPGYGSGPSQAVPSEPLLDTSSGVPNAADANAVAFTHTVNKSGNVTVLGDPAVIRSTFTDLKGATVFADGKPAGIMFGLTDSPAVLAQLKPTESAVAPTQVASGPKQAFMRPEDVMRNSVASAAQELAMQVHSNSQEADFDPKEIPQAITQWAKQANVPVDDLRIAFKGEIEKRDFRRKAGVLQAINPVKQAIELAKLSPQEKPGVSSGPDTVQWRGNSVPRANLEQVQRDKRSVLRQQEKNVRAAQGTPNEAGWTEQVNQTRAFLQEIDTVLKPTETPNGITPAQAKQTTQEGQKASVPTPAQPTAVSGMAIQGEAPVAPALVTLPSVNGIATTVKQSDLDSGKAILPVYTNDGQPKGTSIQRDALQVDRQAPVAPEFVKIRTRLGDTRYFKQADLDSIRTLLPSYTAKGERRPDGAVHRENLDPTGAIQAEENAKQADNPFFNVITTKQGSAFATKTAASLELNKRGLRETHEVVPASEVASNANGGFVLRRIELTGKSAMDAQITTALESVSTTDIAQLATKNPEAALKLGLARKGVESAQTMIGRVQPQQAKEFTAFAQKKLDKFNAIKSEVMPTATSTETVKLPLTDFKQELFKWESTRQPMGGLGPAQRNEITNIISRALDGKLIGEADGKKLFAAAKEGRAQFNTALTAMDLNGRSTEARKPNQRDINMERTARLNALDKFKRDTRKETNIPAEKQAAIKEAFAAIDRAQAEHDGLSLDSNPKEWQASVDGLLTKAEAAVEATKPTENAPKVEPGAPIRGTNDAMTNTNVVGKQGGRSADDSTRGDFPNSKVVDTHGKLLTVYHGTIKAFDKFDPEAEPYNYEGDRGKQFFLDSAKGAGDYAIGTSEDHGGNPNIRPVHLNIENPRIEHADRTPSEWWDDNGDLAWKLDTIDKGHDGLIIHGDGGTMYVTSSPDQIKSIFDRPTKNEPTAPESGGAQPAGKIEDSGQVLEGARKLYAKAYAAKLDEGMGMDTAAVPLAKSWPEPDYQRMLDDGTDPWAVAFAHAARDEIPNKPGTAWKVKGWVQKVELLREFTAKVMAGDGAYTFQNVREKSIAHNLGDWLNKVDLYQAVGHAESLKGVTFSSGQYSMYAGQTFNPAKTLWAITEPSKSASATWSHGNWGNELAVAETKADAIAKYQAYLATQGDKVPAPTKGTVFDIYSYRSKPGLFIIGKRLSASKSIDLKTFPTAKEAREYKANNQAELETLLEKAKFEPPERRDDNAPRVGEDHRDSADVTTEQFRDTFGFRGEQFGASMPQGERQSNLNQAYDALMDLAGVIGIPPKALSLNGELGLAFGARGTGGIHAAAAHYERDTTGAVTPNRVVINLTRKNGAGSLAHEFFHAVDNYFARMRGEKAGMLTDNPNITKEGVRPEMVEAFVKLKNAIAMTGMKERSQQLDKKRVKEYWSTGPEMAARAFESYVIAKLQDQSASNDYLANIVPESLYALQNAYPYPSMGEMPQIRAAFDHFFDTVQTKETDKGVAMYSWDKSGSTLQGDEFWRKIKAGESFTNKELIDAYSIGRRGTTRASSGISGAGNTSGTEAATALASWREKIAGFSSYKTVGVADSDGSFTMGVIPESLFEGTSLQAVDRTAIVRYRFDPVDGGFRLGIVDAEYFGKAYLELAANGELKPTKHTDEAGDPYFKIDVGGTTSKALLQEAVRRLALHIGAVPKITFPSRDTGARAKQFASGRSYDADFTESKFSLDKSGVLDRIAYQGYEKQPVPVVQGTRKLNGIVEKFDAGKLTPAEFEMQTRLLASRMAEAANAKSANRIMSERARGADLVREKLIAARRRGDLNPDMVEFALWALDKNPNLAEGLGVSVKQPGDNTPAGRYNPAASIMALFKDGENEGTAVHEIMHHAERMMPEDVQKGIRTEWSKAYAKAVKNATPEQRIAMEQILEAMAGKTQAHDAVVKSFSDGTLNYDEHYQLVNPSEYWAVNATKILSGRHDATTWMGRVKQWFKEMVEKAKGILGLRSDAPILKAMDDVFNGNGAFQSKNMLSDLKAFEDIKKEENKGIPEETKAQAAHWNSPEPSRFDDLVYKLQDKQVDTKRVIESIKKISTDIADNINVYLQETLFHGRAAKSTKDFIDKELNPMMTQMRMRGIDIPTLDKYLHARHAEEANNLIAERNPEIQDGGSGMLTKDAKAYLASLNPAEAKRLEAVATQVDAIIAKTRQTYADYHLESQATVDGWGKMFEHYVPLMREDKDGGMGIGQGFSIKGRETKGRIGSTRNVVDILANIAMQRERAIVRGEKNRVSTALYGLAGLNPNPEFWSVGKPPTEQVYDPKTNTVVERQDPLFKSRANAMVAKIKDAKGNIVEKAVIFNEDNERAVRMAAALKNLDAAQLEGLIGMSAKLTRYFSAISTQYNPIFGVVNLTRDFQEAMINLSSTPLKGHKAEVASHVLSALKGIYLDERAARDGKTPTSAWATLWEEFQNEGGQTGYRDMFRNSSDRAKAIAFELDPNAWMDGTLGKIFTAGGALKVPLAIAQKKAVGLFGWLSDYNEAMENSTRLSVYKVGKEQGMSNQQAAALAKGITVNFNRRGQVGQQAGALFAFWNASMQGSARIAQTLFDMDGSDVKSIRLSSVGKKVVAGGVMLGVMQALMLAAAGFDDEDPPDFVRERSLIIPIGGKKYVTIPMPLGFSLLPNLGRIPTELALNGFRDPAKHIMRLFGLVTSTFNPIGGASSMVQMISPTALDPLVAISENKDWTGKPIAKVSMNRATPGYTLARDTASYPSKIISEAINFMSGGDKYKAGVLSPTPDQIDYLWGQATGGVGRELSKAAQTGAALYSGEELPTYKIPLVGRFYGNSETQASQASQFYANVNTLNEHEAEIKGLRKDGKGAEISAYLKDNPEARLFEVANRVEREIQKLHHRKSELLAKDAPKEQVKAIDEAITRRMATFNEIVKASKLRKAA